MDHQPLMRENFNKHDNLPTIRAAFQESARKTLYPKDIAKNILRNEVDDELQIRQNAVLVLETYGDHDDNVERIYNMGNEIMTQQGLYYIKKDKIDCSYELREHMKLKRCDLFKKLHKEYVEEFGLIVSNDLLPNMIKQFLDFRYNKDQICEKCAKKTHQKKEDFKRKKKLEDKPSELRCKARDTCKEPFRITPNSVNFHNYEPGVVYTRILKISNTSPNMQSISIRSFPKDTGLIVNLDPNSKLAPGMSVSVSVTFKPDVFRHVVDSVVFKNCRGTALTVPITVTRDFPRLITCIFRSTTSLLERAKPEGDTFLENRREALNSTIDCGACLVSRYQLLSVIIENKGMDGKFFIITEDEWFFRDIESVSNSMELYNGGFWIYPTFFEVNNGDIAEIHIIFQPTCPGLHVEKLYLICDNNSFEQIEVMGDSVEFSKSFVTIDVGGDNDVHEHENYCIFLGNIENQSTKSLTLTVHNKSSLHLNFVWRFQHKPPNNKVHNIQESWIHLLNETPILLPYSTSDFDFNISPEAAMSGYHSIFFGLFIINIPMISLEEDVEFFVKACDGDTDPRTMTVDVLIADIQVACFIRIPEKVEPPLSCPCERCELVPRRPKLVFSKHFFTFGIIPTGLNIQKDFLVECCTDEEIEWRIFEVRYNIDDTPYSQILKSENVSCNCGRFSAKGEYLQNAYIIKNQQAPTSWVSFLVLVSVEENKIKNIESICVVSFEIIHYDIIITTDHSTAPILCPLKLIYIGVPVHMSFTIQNRSPITGCFYFLKPYGADKDIISLELNPMSSILKPNDSVEVEAKLTCKEIGIFDKFFVPCFIGNGQEPIELRVLCAVDGMHMFFYLPDKKNSFKKLMWPRKVVYEYDENWINCCCFEEESLEHNTKEEQDSLMYMYSKDLQNLDPVFQPDAYSSDKEIAKEDTVDKESSNYTSTNSSSLLVSNNENLVDILSEEFIKEELVLQEEIVEIQVSVKTPTKLTMYLENITPIKTNYSIEAQNFRGNKNFDQVQVKLCLKKKDAIWDDLIDTEYGILVQPECESGHIAEFNSVMVNLWIYANTWGLYMEEVVIDIPDIPSFAFSLLIDAVGCPVMFPMGLNRITKYPVLRFGGLPHNSEDTKRRIRIANTSCVPVNIVWHKFLRTAASDKPVDQEFNLLFDLVNEENFTEKGKLFLSQYYGKETHRFCEIIPAETRIEATSSKYIEVVLKPDYFRGQVKKTEITCTVLGHIYLEECYRKKLNYFCRKIGPSANQINLDVLLTLEYPLLTLDIICDETKIIIYANEVVFEKSYDHVERFVLRNNYLSPCEATIVIDEPFFIRNKNNQLCQMETFVVNPMDFLEIIVNCYVDHQKILDLSELIFDKDYTRRSFGFFFCVDKDNNVLDLLKKCRIFQGGSLMGIIPTHLFIYYPNIRVKPSVVKFDSVMVGVTKKTLISVYNLTGYMIIPIHLFIYYPNIRVKPSVVKFDSVMVGVTKKTLISVYNLTGYMVSFEVCKSKTADDFYVTPHYGTIEKSTGVNSQFMEIYIYFTPRESRVYQESIRIVTNIPNYYIEIPLIGTGTVNEKFYVDYKT